MTDYLINLANAHAQVGITFPIEMNVGDRIYLQAGGSAGSGGIVRGQYELYSPFKEAELIGDFPPELPKNSSYFIESSYSPRMYHMKRYVTLYTPGTYTFQTCGFINSTVYPASTLRTFIVKRPTPTIPVNVSGSWKDSEGSVNVNGAWKTIDNAYVNVNGAWKEI